MGSIDGTLGIWRMALSKAAGNDLEKLTGSAYMDSHPLRPRQETCLCSGDLSANHATGLTGTQRLRQTEARIDATPAEKYSPVISSDGLEVAFSASDRDKHSVFVYSSTDKSTSSACVGCGDPAGWSSRRDELLITSPSNKVAILNRQSGTLRVILENSNFTR